MTNEGRRVAVFMLSHVRDLPDEKRHAVLDFVLGRLIENMREGTHVGTTHGDLNQLFGEAAIKFDF